jgi:hypothetical protein
LNFFCLLHSKKLSGKATNFHLSDRIDFMLC